VIAEELMSRACPLVRLLCISQFFSRIFAEVGLEKGFRFRKSQVKAGERLDFQLQRVSLEVEQVTAMLAVSREKMKVVARDTERTCKPR